MISVFSVLLVGCAHNYESTQQAVRYGFFSGLWHGLISPFSIVGVELLNFSSIEIIGRPNTGGGYESGFGFGVAQWFYVLYSIFRKNS